MKENTFVGSVDISQFAGSTSLDTRPHEFKLARMLEIAANPESGEAKDKARMLVALEKEHVIHQVAQMPRALGEILVDDFKERRDLLLSETVESTTLIQAEFYNTVLEGAEPNKVMRNMLKTVNTNRLTETFTLGETGSVLPVVAEGAELKNNQQDYTSVNLTAKKYGEKGIISSELIEDSLFDIVAMEVAKSGARAENTLNHVALTTLLDDAGNEHDCAGASLGYPALAAARKEMQNDFYSPDVCIVTADAEYVLGIDSQLTYASYFGGAGQTPALRGELPSVFGMRMAQYDPADTTYNSGTYTWSYGTNAEIGMVLVDSASMAALIGIRRDITVEKYSDPIHDLKGAALTMRFGVATPFDNGICRVEY